MNIPLSHLSHRAAFFILLLLTALSACAPPRAITEAPGQASAPVREVPQRLVTIVLRAEPPALFDRIDRMGLGQAWNVTLAQLEKRETPRPMLAERLAR